jgi:hypothetical protein
MNLWMDITLATIPVQGGSNNDGDSDDGESSRGGSDTFSDGQRAGKAQGHSDAINGRPSDASCGSGA